MKMSGLLRESWRNVLSGTTRTLTLAVLFGIFTAGLIVADLGTVKLLTDQAIEYQESGASVLTIAAPGQIDGAKCESLNDIPGIRAAGAFRSPEARVTLSAIPDSPLAIKEMTTGFASVLHANAGFPAGIYLSTDAAESLGLKTGEEVATTSGASHVAGLFDYPDDGRRPGFGYVALLVNNDERPYDECWADAWPAISSLPNLLLTTVLPSNDDSGDEQPILSQLNTTLGKSFDGPARFASRVSANLWVAAAIGGLLLAMVSLRLRRMQIASGLHSGVPRSNMYFMLLLETCSWSALVFLWSLIVVLFFSSIASSDDRLVTFVLGMRTAISAQIGVILGMTVAALSTRERHLFRYFKER
jgi:hypothetical protein